MGQWEKKTRQLERSVKAEGFNIKLYNLSVSVGFLKSYGSVKRRQLISNVKSFFAKRSRGKNIKRSPLSPIALLSADRGPPVIGLLSNFIIIFLMLILLTLSSCSVNDAETPTPEPVKTPVTISGQVTKTDLSLDKTVSTLAPIPLESIDVLVEYNGTDYTDDTDKDGNYIITIPDNKGKSTIKYNFSRSNEDIIPSVYEDVSLTNDVEVNIDLVSKSELFQDLHSWIPRDVAIEKVIEIYRGRGNKGLNQVWVKQPGRWVVLDYDGDLNAHPEYLDTIIKGWKHMNDNYADGFFEIPEKSDIIFINDKESIDKTQDMLYTIDMEGAGEADVENANNELIYSKARGPPTDWNVVVGECHACVQGGDNESSELRTIFDGALPEYNPPSFLALHKRFGKFNYKLRKPGSIIYAPSFSPNGQMYEKRVWTK